MFNICKFVELNNGDLLNIIGIVKIKKSHSNLKIADYVIYKDGTMVDVNIEIDKLINLLENE